MKNYFFVSIGFLFFAGSALYAQIPPTVEWSETYGGTSGDHATAIRHTTDGGYIVAGHTGSTDGDINDFQGGAWIVKLDADGSLEWEETYGGAIAIAYDVQQTTDGSYIVAGYGKGEFGQDLWVSKLNYDGSLAWEETYGGSGVDWASAIRQTADGGYIVAGQTDSDDGDVSESQGVRDAWVLKLDSGGNLDWEQTYGGSEEDTAMSIQQTPAGDYIVAAETESLDGDIAEYQGGTSDIWIFKIDADGDLYWEQTYGGSDEDSFRNHSTEFNDVIEQTTDGGYIISGYTASSDGDIGQIQGGGDIWVLKLDAGGNMDWEQTYGGTDRDIGGSIQQTLDGNYIIGGYTSSNDGDVGEGPVSPWDNLWFFKIDPSGNILWEQDYDAGQTDVYFLMDIQQVSGCEYVIIGYGLNYTLDFWVLKVRIDLEPPAAPSPQSFCWSDAPVLGDLQFQAGNTVEGFPPTHTWYADQEKTTVLSDNGLLLEDGEDYYVSETIDGCESPLRKVEVAITPDTPPMGSSPQGFCEGEAATLADLSVTGENLSWYSDAAGTASLTQTTQIQDGETYYVTQTTDNCESSTLPIEANINPLPAANPPPPYILCDGDNDGAEGFHLPNLDNDITGGASGTTVSYHKTLAGAEAGTPALPDDYANEQSPSQTIYARVEDGNTGCFVIAEATLRVSPVPEVSGAEDLSGCDNGNNEAVFDLTQNDEDVLGNQNPNGLDISYHETQPDAESGDNAIATPKEYASGPKAVFVRLESAGTDCYDTGSFQLKVIPRPAIDDTPIALEVCSDGEGGNTAVVDLAQFDAQINPGSPANTIVVYYANANAHQNGDPVQNPESHIAFNSQTVLAETVDTETGCASLTQTEITITVNDRPVVDLDNATLCWDGDPSTPVEGGNYGPVVLDTGLDENEYGFEWAFNGDPLAGDGPSLEVTEPGTYEVKVSDTDGTTTTCTTTASASVAEANPPEFALVRLTGTVGNPHRILVSEVSGPEASGGSFEFSLDDGQWLPLGNDGTLVFENVPPGTHVVYGRSLEGCGTTVKTITLIGYPKFFTPNNDGQNDRWNIIGLREGELYIFDRYGKLLASLDPNGMGWDGSYNGHPMPSDDYWFRVKFTETLPDGSERPGEFRANFSLVR